VCQWTIIAVVIITKNGEQTCFTSHVHSSKSLEQIVHLYKQLPLSSLALYVNIFHPCPCYVIVIQTEWKTKQKKTIRYEYNRSKWIEFPFSWSKFKTVFFCFSTIINWCEKIIHKDVRHLLKERNERKHKKRGRIQKRNFFFFLPCATAAPSVAISNDVEGTRDNCRGECCWERGLKWTFCSAAAAAATSSSFFYILHCSAQ
jgi:hypothetical protein